MRRYLFWILLTLIINKPKDEPLGTITRSDCLATMSGAEDTAAERCPWSLLALAFPSATACECQRFHEAYGDKASEHLQAYLEWRAMYPHDEQAAENAWERAWNRTWDQVEKCQADGTGQTVLFPKSMTLDSPASEEDLTPFQRTPVPQYVFAHNNNSTTTIILQVLPARIDLKLACAEIHALAAALYLDQFVEATAATVDVWVDVRGAPPWPNGAPMKLLHLIRTMAARLLALQPERLQRLVIFPLPGWAVAIYNMIRAFLPVVVTSRTVLVAGSDRHDVPPPSAKMEEHLSGDKAKETVQQMEATRQQAVMEAERAKATT
jgi:hypothetical protein